ncbi:hypothetical protein BTHE_1570 [Bifidobacterium thermophilum]|nr:hypothetical protein BTHE_1570 [Bifidobacterium thermophilum]
MPTELTFAILKYGYLILLWVFLWLVVRSLRRDVETFSPRKSLSSRRRDRKARKAAKTATPRTCRRQTVVAGPPPVGPAVAVGGD